MTVDRVEEGATVGRFSLQGGKPLPPFNCLKYIPTKNCLLEIYSVKPKIS
jgi:hypothetical protein